MKINYRSLIFLISTFFLIQIIGLYTGYSLSKISVIEQMPAEQSLIWFSVSFLIATLLLILGIRFFKGKFFFGILFLFILFVGSQTVFSSFLPEAIAIILAAFLVLIRHVKPSPLIHNTAIGIAIAGIGAQIGLMLPISTVLILFVALSAYDIFAVYGTKHMVTMFKGLSEKGVLLSLAIPENKKNLTKSLKKLKPGKGSGFFMLGTGDLVFPLILAVSVLSFGIFSSLSVIFGSLLGVLTVFYLLSKNREPMPALPPIAFFSVLGFLISLIPMI